MKQPCWHYTFINSLCAEVKWRRGGVEGERKIISWPDRKEEQDKLPVSVLLIALSNKDKVPCAALAGVTGQPGSFLGCPVLAGLSPPALLCSYEYGVVVVSHQGLANLPHTALSFPLHQRPGGENIMKKVSKVEIRTRSLTNYCYRQNRFRIGRLTKCIACC